MEGEAMVGSGSVLTDGFPVDGGGVTFVFVPMILGIFFVDAKHEVIAISFGEDGGRSNAHVCGIALDNGGVGDVFVRHETIAVDE